MSNTSSTSSTTSMVGTRRLSQVFVELRTLPHVSSADHKENALSVAQKRKLDVDGPVPAEPAAKKQHAMPQNATDDHPNDFIYCHQCNKKRDVAVSVRCTTIARGRRCNAKYCKPCLKNRYGLLLEDILADGKTGHGIHAEGYHFRCPRCSDVCNCVACRKAKGLQPTGNLANAARQCGLASAADVLRRDPKAAGPMAHKPAEKKTNLQHSAHATASKHDNNTNKSHSAPAKSDAKLPKSDLKPKPKLPPKPKVKALPKPKLLAKPVWTSVGTALSLTEVEERINFREFALRFSSILQLPRSHLDELDEIRASHTRTREDAGDDDLVPWVSEACLKSLLIGLLNIIDAKGDGDKHVKATVKSIRESGAHLNKMWAALATLRDWEKGSSSVPLPSPFLFLPDPLPPPESVSIIRTRSGANQSNAGSVNIVRTTQFFPVIATLVDAAVESEAVRQELEAGTQESKERVKEAREAHRIENERFEQEKDREKKTGKRLDKPRTEYHKHTVAIIDDALKVASYANIPRISPLGRDIEGRIYWALTPGMNEREDALNLLQSYGQGRTHKSKSRRKPLVPSEEDRSALTKWSWIVAVWGKRPPTTERTLDDNDSDSDSEDEDEDEQWWGFWEPEEVMKLASWVHFKAGLGDISPRTLSPDTDVDMGDLTDDNNSDDQSDDDDMEATVTPSNREIATLVRELEQYASLLRGRIEKDE